MTTNKKVWIVLISAIILFFVSFSILFIYMKIQEGKHLQQIYIRCVAGCGGKCSNDFRNELRKLSPDEQVEKLRGIYYSKEEILKEVEECKRKNHNFSEPLYPYEELHGMEL
ncbi:MAG: hypothetical protein U9O20_04440 [Patescibacteria group bacterium]|nr:hypothetical protein [Patescibacteria group bacterium]